MEQVRVCTALRLFSQSQCSQKYRTPPIQDQSFLLDTGTSVASVGLQRCVRLGSRCSYSVVHAFLTSVINHKVLAREQTRDTVDLIINLRADIAERLSVDRFTRAMIYSASDPMSPFSKVDIEFPYQLEIKINQDEVQGSFRGLKNKPGTTRPVDITTMLRPKPGYDNHMVVTYALTKKVSFSG